MKTWNEYLPLKLRFYRIAREEARLLEKLAGEKE
tara:strand:+ start:1561 stop:1662 length:102 start_codon:yes stop_codon:yes gene_type:complete